MGWSNLLWESVPGDNKRETKHAETPHVGQVGRRSDPPCLLRGTEETRGKAINVTTGRSGLDAMEEEGNGGSQLYRVKTVGQASVSV